MGSCPASETTPRVDAVAASLGIRTLAIDDAMRIRAVTNSTTNNGDRWRTRSRANTKESAAAHRLSHRAALRTTPRALFSAHAPRGVATRSASSDWTRCVQAASASSPPMRRLRLWLRVRKQPIRLQNSTSLTPPVCATP